ncbi:hypothetical protein CL176_08925 [Suicoccus acidiformans]|uniref:Nitroreductase domain-containing protein n=1 Tax=Suicoccus acidiformans TaxID=2036206 RepID=A0A347WM04_9LACT|nr:hypothetical protein [Suicoccus acidiformans]AXY26111.1 hypothetical protein CL176_08925 [Suicoccus acidiformans]
MLNETIAMQLTHRTVREYIDKPVEEEKIWSYLEVMNSTSHLNLQNYSLIRFTDAYLKTKLAEVTGKKYMAAVPELCIFIIDLYRSKYVNCNRI